MKQAKDDDKNSGPQAKFDGEVNHTVKQMMGDSLTYYGPVNIGTSETASATLNVVYDTGSDWLVVEGKTCAVRSICKGNVYDP